MRVVHRTARIALRLTRAQRRRCFGLLRGGGDVWAALVELNRVRFRRGGKPLANYQELCREVAGTPVGELSVTAVRSVLRRYSDAFFEAARRKQRGERARYPRRKRALVPLRWYSGTFTLDPGRVTLSVARGCPQLALRLARSVPYPCEHVRAVTLVVEAGRLFLDVTAALPVEDHGLDTTRVAGVDLGIIHPIAMACGDDALVVSEDTKRRAKCMGATSSGLATSPPGAAEPRRLPPS